MRAIKIDVVTKTIYEVDLKAKRDGSTMESLQQLLDVDCFTMVSLGEGYALWIDDEGLYREPPLGAFKIKEDWQAFSGHGIITGLNGPATVAATIPIEAVVELVTFVPNEELPEPRIEVFSL